MATLVLTPPVPEQEADERVPRPGIVAALAYRRWRRAAEAAGKPAENPQLAAFLGGLAELMEEPIE
jgi:hypothetical protein